MLAKIQEDLLKSIATGKYSKALSWIKPSRIAPNKRLDVYRHNTHETLRRALELTYPKTWKLIGKECADSAAYHFAKSHIPTTGCLEDWGEEFPCFLNNFVATSPLPYLKDLAQLEWLEHLSYGAAECKPLPLEELQNCLSQEMASLSFTFHPSCYLLHSRYPLNKIITLIENEEIKGVSLDDGEVFAFISRPYTAVSIQWISLGLYTFLKSLKLGNNLERAVLSALDTDAPFNAYEAFSFAFQNNIFIHVIHS